MSWSEELPSRPPAPPLRDLVLGAFATLICILEAEIGFCADCRRAADGLCADHRSESAMADAYKAALERIADADVLVLALGGSGVTA